MIEKVKFCPGCGFKIRHTFDKTYFMDKNGERRLIRTPCLKCKKCGETIFDAEQLKLREEKIVKLGLKKFEKER